ncbi:hypothetical protein BD414DRAFT_498537 [Trametes punicea]|nr:hypothetical protein BD414DRAFT_498537 [Trametes punicea]
MDHINLLPASRLNRLVLVYSQSHAQTARVVDLSTGATRAEFRGHDNVVESAIFAPRNAAVAISELAGLKANEAFAVFWKGPHTAL